MLMSASSSKIRSFEDLAKLGRPVVAPVLGPDDDFLVIAMVGKMTGLQLKYVSGYAGQADTFLACQRGEGDIAMTSLTTASTLIKNGDMQPILLIGSDERAKDYPNTPTAGELAKTPEDKESLKAVNNMVSLFLNYWYPPSVKPEVVAEMRGIMEKALTDKEAVERMPLKVGKRELTFMSGAEVQKRVEQILTEGKKLTPMMKDALQSLK